MDEFIKREDALNAIKALRSVCGCSAIDRDDAENAIMDCHTADVVPKSEVRQEVVKILSDIKRQIHEKAIYPHNAGIKPYISVREIDTIIEKEISHAKGGG